MLSAVKGIYENGQITLEEALPTKKARVLVAIIEEIEEKTFTKRPFGIMKGSVKLSADFNEPLEDLRDYM